MPWIPNMDEEPQPGQGAVAPGAGGTRLSPGGIGSAPSAGAAPAPKDAGGSFATLGSYLTANQGQAAPLANQITSGIQNQYNTLQGQNASTLSGIQNQVTQGYTPMNQDVLTQEAANPVSFASNPGNVQSFQSQLADKFTGPTSAESTPDYQNQQTAINNAIATGTAQTGTEAGREQLLQQNEARPTTGVTALNSAILTQSPDYLSQVQGAYKPFSNLVSNLSSGAQGIDTNIGQATKESQTASDTANKQIADQTAALNTNVNTELGNLQNTYNQYNTGASTLASNLQGGKLPTGYGVDPGLQAFITSNITPWVNSYAPGQTPSYNFANATPQFPTAVAPNVNQAATPQDFATLQALGTISGTPVASPLTGLNPALAGTYTTPTLPNINNTALAGDIYSGLNSINANVATAPYTNYIGLLQALDNYQKNGQSAFGGTYNPNQRTYLGGPTEGQVTPTIA